MSNYPGRYFAPLPPSPVLKAKMKKVRIPKVLKDHTWDKWVGDTIAKTKCMCCGINNIKMNDFHCSHVIAEANGGLTSVENLRPVCASCNLSMGTKNMDVFRASCGFGLAEVPLPEPLRLEPLRLEPQQVFTNTLTNIIHKGIKKGVNHIMKDKDVGKWAPSLFTIGTSLLKHKV
jgi:hypothetical protein